MKKSSFSRFPVNFLLVAVCLAMVFISRTGSAQDDGATQTGKIDISADNLVIDNAKKYAEFTGSVEATQGNTTIKSDRLVIFYREKKSGNGDAADEDLIEKVVAQGQVVITFDGNVAETAKAEYTTADKRLVLSGPGSKITGEKGSLTGSEIIINRENGHTKVKGPVTGSVFAGDNGID